MNASNKPKCKGRDQRGQERLHFRCFSSRKVQW
jgi:hypothetical protein